MEWDKEEKDIDLQLTLNSNELEALSALLNKLRRK